MILTLQRFAYSPEGTFGRLTLPSGKVLFTCEQPWNGNAQKRSCIPEGYYATAMRDSPVVQRSSGGQFSRGWEVLNVPERTFIMIHPANWPHELQGCISVGREYAVINGKNGVTSSRAAFAELMAELDGLEWELNITHYRAGYP